MATDDFNRTAESPLSQGGNWSSVGSFATLDTDGTGCHIGTSSTDNVMRYSGDTFASNHYSEFTITNFSVSGTQFIGAATRLTSGGDGYVGYVLPTTNTFEIYRVDSGSFTALVNSALTTALATADVIRFASDGSTHTLTVNTVVAGSGAAQTDTNHTGGEPGIGLFDSNSPGTAIILDDWTGLDIASDISLAPPQANLTLDSTIHLVVNSGAYQYEPGVGDLVLSGTAPSVDNTEQNKIPAAADLTLSTVAPTLNLTARTFLSIPATDLALTTTAPGLAETTASKVPAAADLTLSTTAPALALTGERVPAAANLVLSTTAPAIIFQDDHARTPLGGNLVFTTFAPTLGAVTESDDPSFDIHIGKSIIAARGLSIKDIHMGYRGIIGKR